MWTTSKRLSAWAIPPLGAGVAVWWAFTGSTLDPWSLSPLAAVLLLPPFLLLYTLAHYGAAPAAAVLVAAWCYHVARGDIAIPRASRIFLVALAVLSAVYFVWLLATGRAAGSERFGRALLANLVWLGACGALALPGSRRPSLLVTSLFYTVLFVGLFSVGFPMTISAGRHPANPTALPPLPGWP